MSALLVYVRICVNRFETKTNYFLIKVLKKTKKYGILIVPNYNDIKIFEKHLSGGYYTLFLLAS